METNEFHNPVSSILSFAIISSLQLAIMDDNLMISYDIPIIVEDEWLNCYTLQHAIATRVGLVSSLVEPTRVSIMRIS